MGMTKEDRNALNRAIKCAQWVRLNGNATDAIWNLIDAVQIIAKSMGSPDNALEAPETGLPAPTEHERPVSNGVHLKTATGESESARLYAQIDELKAALAFAQATSPDQLETLAIQRRRILELEAARDREMNRRCDAEKRIAELEAQLAPVALGESAEVVPRTSLKQEWVKE